MTDIHVARVAARFLYLTRELGYSTRDAWDALLGAGAYERFASDLYDQLRAKAGR